MGSTDMYPPDYHNSLVNLMATIEASMGGTPGPYTPLAALAGMAPAEGHTVLLIIDGLGDAFLDRHAGSFLARHRRARLTSVFPSTTASAITSFFTGMAPQQHAITGWFTYLREIGTVATILPFTPRHGGGTLSDAGLDPGQFIGASPMSERLPVAVDIVSPEFIVDSPYSVAATGPARRHGYRDLGGLFETVGRCLRNGPPGLVVAYWPDLDSTAHQFGINSDQSDEVFARLDRVCADHLPRFAAAGHRLLVTADHGLMDTDEAHTLYLEDHPDLGQTLALPLCGEPRAAFCYMRPDRRADFEGYVREVLDFACELHSGRELIEAGWFGLGEPHSALGQRVGDYVLLMKESYVIRDRLPNEGPFRQIGVHGGLSREEMFVPLIVV